MANKLIAAGIFILILTFVAGLAYLEYVAYHQRFPNAEWWTFFFQHK